MKTSTRCFAASAVIAPNKPFPVIPPPRERLALWRSRVSAATIESGIELVGRTPRSGAHGDLAAMVSTMLARGGLRAGARRVRPLRRRPRPRRQLGSAELSLGRRLCAARLALRPRRGAGAHDELPAAVPIRAVV